MSDSLRCQASQSITNYQSLRKLMSIESVMPSNHLILCRPLLLLASIFPSIKVFSESVLLIRWPKYWPASVLLINTQDWFPWGWTGLISLQSKGLSRVFSNHSWSDAIQTSHSLLSPSPHALNLSQHQGFFPMSQLFASGGQIIGTSASASVLPMNIQDWFLWGLTGLISLQSLKGLSRVFSSTTVWKHRFFGTQPSLWSSSHIHTWLLDKPLLWLYGTLSEMWCLYFLIHCLGCHSFPSKKQPSFNFMAAVTICSDFGAQENKVCHCFHFLAFYLPWSDGTRCHDLCFLNAEF